MKVLIDSNILISAALNPKGIPYKAFLKAATPPNVGVVCQQNIEEIRIVFKRKFPDKMELLEKFLSIALFSLEIKS